MYCTEKKYVIHSDVVAVRNPQNNTKIILLKIQGNQVLVYTWTHYRFQVIAFLDFC